MQAKRYWMTGCMALVLLVAGRGIQREEQDDDSEGSQRTRISLISRFDASETARQIERSARRSGLPVLVRTAVPASPVADGVAMRRSGEAAAVPAENAAQVLVLGDEGRQTAMMQPAGQALPELPWAVVIRPLPDGQAEVLLPDALAVAPPDGVSADTLDKLRALPQLVRSAVT